MPPAAWGRRAKQPCRTDREVPKRSLSRGWAAGRPGRGGTPALVSAAVPGPGGHRGALRSRTPGIEAASRAFPCPARASESKSEQPGSPGPPRRPRDPDTEGASVLLGRFVCLGHRRRGQQGAGGWTPTTSGSKSEKGPPVSLLARGAPPRGGRGCAVSGLPPPRPQCDFKALPWGHRGRNGRLSVP